MKYLLDTDWVIDYLHRVQPIVANLEAFLPEGIGLSIMSVAELYEGVFRSSDPQNDEEALRMFLDEVEVLPVDDAVCRTFGRERGRLRAEGNIIGDFDILIGATAICHDLTLLTNNRRHFQRIQGLTILHV